MDDPTGQGPSSLALPGAGQSPPDVMGALQGAHDHVKAMFGAMTKAKAKTDKIRAELTSLAKLGDQVTPEDVIHGAGSLVGAGIDPMQLTSLLADMPQGGPALASWISDHAATMTQHEAQMSQQLALVRHEMGVSGLRMLAAHASHGDFAGLQQASPQLGPAGALDLTSPTAGSA